VRVPPEHAPDIIDLRCTRRGALSVAELAPDEDPWELNAWEWVAVARPDAECPDHPHAFTVEP